jgi:hypothetical protein
MSDRREALLIKANHDFIDEKGFPLNQSDVVVLVCKTAAISAMDEYMRETCLELLGYVGKNIKWSTEADGNILFWNGEEYLTAQKLFENFL